MKKLCTFLMMSLLLIFAQSLKAQSKTPTQLSTPTVQKSKPSKLQYLRVATLKTDEAIANNKANAIKSKSVAIKSKQPKSQSTLTTKKASPLTIKNKTAIPTLITSNKAAIISTSKSKKSN